MKVPLGWVLVSVVCTILKSSVTHAAAPRLVRSRPMPNVAARPSSVTDPPDLDLAVKPQPDPRDETAAAPGFVTEPVGRARDTLDTDAAARDLGESFQGFEPKGRGAASASGTLSTYFWSVGSCSLATLAVILIV
jgi:hypothetical protein